MHIQQGNFGADIEPVYDRATYVLNHYSYVVTDSTKAHAVVFRGTAKDAKSAIAAAEKQLGKLLDQATEKSAAPRAA